MTEPTEDADISDARIAAEEIDELEPLDDLDPTAPGVIDIDEGALPPEEFAVDTEEPGSEDAPMAETKGVGAELPRSVSHYVGEDVDDSWLWAFEDDGGAV